MRDLRQEIAFWIQSIRWLKDIPGAELNAEHATLAEIFVKSDGDSHS